MSDNVHRPLIAVTVGRDLPDRPSVLRLTENYVRVLTNAGAIPIVIVPGIDIAAVQYVMERVDGLLLPGGIGAPDPHPRQFGEDPRPETVIDADLDALEIAAIHRAVRLGMPVLGICRGCQILNVALGGSLIQHLEPGDVSHLPGLPLDAEAHELRLEDGSRLAGLSGARLLRVNSLHHQAIARPAPALRVVGRAEDGIVEAVESADPDRWITGVQYHPEELTSQPAHRRLFEDFISWSARYAADRDQERTVSA
ncbi:gamma-glutamyl-gamma-aminobutyrate hydrolase family protein [Streptomyces sp. ME18-1-4]|uniref:gamma-glutamyl-gamma-aminobutyrate hydrolase family protein n=1 Tax=Streptomyces sp. ME18-1-4 TaxID=3028685 RepID=UPI0029B0D881|nr:gamma-glutamyl-gamma-aminobutyrate hydrolase family protein [Streptomyces sp. ME18-1-4]MDX3247084.1 gamma-glutamyl-gamma-aminobutyrate hydrolase family protein [Streptomyces sp. ME18-1-4]